MSDMQRTARRGPASDANDANARSHDMRCHTTPARVVGTYLSEPLDKMDQPAFVRAVLSLPNVTGLEIPLCSMHIDEHSSWLIDVLPAGSRHVATLMVACNEHCQQDPSFGLASTDPEGRRRALDLLDEARKRIARLEGLGQHVVAIEVQSGPTSDHHTSGSREAFTESLAEAASWDWGQTQLVVEHCDAARTIGGISRGFLTLDDEIHAVEAVRAQSPRTCISIAINWGRSAVDTRNAGGPIAHIDRLQKHNLLAGLILSGASDKDSVYGDAWQDVQLPATSPDGAGEESSLLTLDRAVTAMEHANGNLIFDGVKMAIHPASAPTAERVRYIQELLSVMPDRVSAD